MKLKLLNLAFMKTALARVTLSTVLILGVSCSSVPPAGEPKPPVTYQADVEADMKPGELLITGGWLIEPGQRAYLIVSPEFDTSASEPAGNKNVSIEGRWIQTGVSAFEGTSLAELNTESTETSSFVVLSARRYAQITSQEAEGTATITGNWKSLTMNGKPTEFHAQSAMTVQNSEGDPIIPGISVTFIPEIATDNQSLKLAVEAVWNRQ